MQAFDTFNNAAVFDVDYMNNVLLRPTGPKRLRFVQAPWEVRGHHIRHVAVAPLTPSHSHPPAKALAFNQHKNIALVQAYGLIFSLDNVVANTREALASAWTLLAQRKGFPIPKDPLRLVWYGTSPERIMLDVSGQSLSLSLLWLALSPVPIALCGEDSPDWLFQTIFCSAGARLELQPQGGSGPELGVG